MQTGFRKRGPGPALALKFVWLAAAAALAAGCSTPAKPTVTPLERLRMDGSFGTALAPVVEARLSFAREPVVTRYLEELASTMVRSDPGLREMAVVVSITKNSEGRWKSYGLPGLRLYLSGELIGSLEFENELAAALAFELGHLSRRNAVQRFETLAKDTDPLSDGGIFAFTEEESHGALEAAMKILYSSGYDPRGMVALLGRYVESPLKSPLQPQLAARLLVAARRTIAVNAPLRNPIVRSERFVAMQKRMKSL